MIKITLTFISFCLLPFLYNCSPSGILASSGATGMVVAEGERSLGTVVDDATIKMNVAGIFLQTNSYLFLNINTNVIQGRVLLTGLVDDQETRIEAVRKTWEVDGVKEVINEIEIGNKTTIKEYANDLWINTQVKALAARTIGLRALSYNFETIKGKVYITGLTSRPEQLKEIIESSKTVKGVNEIVNYVIIKE